MSKTKERRRMIEQALIENAQRSNAQIATIVGCSDNTVMYIRRELETHGSISCFAGQPGCPRDSALHERLCIAWLACPNSTQHEIAAKSGCSHTHAGKIRKELETKGLLHPKDMRVTKRQSRTPRDDLHKLIIHELQRNVHQTNVAIAKMFDTDESVVRRLRKRLDDEMETASQLTSNIYSCSLSTKGESVSKKKEMRTTRKPRLPIYPLGAHVYAISPVCGGLTKIGCTGDLSRRFVSIQYMCPIPLTVLWSTPGDYRLELRLHTAFTAQCKYGEWFDLGPDPVSLIQATLAADLTI